MTMFINAFDIFLIFLVFAFGIFGYFRGFSKETLSIGAWVLAIIASNFLSPFLQPLLMKAFNLSALIGNLIAYFVIFMVSIFLFSWIVNKSSKLLHQTEFKSIDQIMGSLIGIVKGIVIACIIYILILWLIPVQEQRPNWFNNARTTPFLIWTANTLETLFLPNSSNSILKQEKRERLDILNNENTYDLLIKPGIRETGNRQRIEENGYTMEERKALEKILFQLNQ